MRSFMLLLAAVLLGCAPEPGPPAAPPQAAPASAPVPGASGPEITGAWVRPVPPTARMTAGYLTLHNPGPRELVIVGAESPSFGSIELHGTETVDGVARMRHQERVVVPAGESVRFEPGGLHLMLMEPVDGIPTTGAFEMSLLLESGERLEYTAAVGQPAG
jgi:periplasmic copper chaperone A